MGASKEPLFLVHMVQYLAFLGYVQVKDNMNIFVSHDWPTHIAHYGNKDSLPKCEPWFRDEVEQDILGSLQIGSFRRPASPISGSRSAWLLSASVKLDPSNRSTGTSALRLLLKTVFAFSFVTKCP
jgi:hypothetical protein